MSSSNGKSDKDQAISYISSISKLSDQDAADLLEHLNRTGDLLHFQDQPDTTDAIQKSQMLKLLYAAVDSAKEMVIITDAGDTIGEEKIIYVNRGIEEVTGYTREELIGKNPRIFQGPDTDQEVLKRLKKKISNGEHFVGETFNYKKDGSKYRVRWSIDPVYDRAGNITHFVSLQQDITEEWKREKKLQKIIEERESLLYEIHHRVKNNLAVITGLLDLQSTQTNSKEAREILSECTNRIQSIATLHEKLYETGDFSSVHLRKYIRELVNYLVQTLTTHDKEITTNLAVDSISLPTAKAVPLALILNETVTNSFKHGFEGQQKGTLDIELKHDETTISLRITDNGVGLPEDLEIENLNSLGLRLIDTLCTQLDGNYRFENQNPGTMFFLQFELEENELKEL